MANLRTARRNVTIVAVALIVIDVVAAFIVISPAWATTAAPTRDNEFRQLRLQVQQKMRAVIPPSQVQDRVDEARQQIAAFVDARMPERSSAIPVELGKLASDAGVQLSSASYDEQQESDVPGTRQVKIGATISGNYLQVVKFINSLERAKTFFVIDSITLGQGEGGGLHLTLRLDAYLRQQS